MRGHGLVEWFDGPPPASLRLYDSLGRLLVHRDLSGLPAGERSLPWETFIGDIDLAAGVYHLRRFDLAAPGRQGTRVLILH